MSGTQVKSAAAIEARNLTKLFGQGAQAVRALDDVSARIAEGEFFTLLGPSGCGKTTLLRMIAGFESPTSGEIRLHGEDITRLPPNRRPVNTVFQSYALFPHLTVAENVAFGLRMLRRPKTEIAATVVRMLALVKLEALAARKTGQLSGGQQQRVALARALAPAPKVLLLDEPLSALDLKLRKEMQVELKRLQTETGITFVFVTHDQEEALTMSDRIAVMSEGRLLQTGTPREIYTHPANRFVASFIGETNFLPVRVENGVAHVAGGRVPLAGTPDAARATLAVRPEHLRLSADGEGLPAVVTHSVYFGTDSHVHLALDDGLALVARLQTGADGGGAPPPGARLRVAFAPGAAQVLED
jgi:spermidine/putrescine transport system ATP-binding protein